MRSRTNVNIRLTTLVFLLAIWCICFAVASADEVHWIPGQSGPPDWSINPGFPTTLDVIGFSGPTDVFSNWCVGEMNAGGIPTLTIDTDLKTIELWFQPPPPVYCPYVYAPVCGLAGSFGPLEAGQWIFSGAIPWPDLYFFWIPFEVQASLVCYYVDAVDGNDLNDGLSWETALATIQKGIDEANNGDTVIVAEGTYTGNGNRDIDFLGKAITVKSANGPENCIIDCDQVNPYPPFYDGFKFQSGEGRDSIVEGFIIINYDHGVGIYCDPGSPTINNCIIKNGYTAVWCATSSSPMITNCTLENTGNSIYIDSGGEATIINCRIQDNIGDGDFLCGGIDCWSNATIINSIFVNNTKAGAIANQGGGEISIKNCTFNNNDCIDGMGGDIGIININGTITITNSILWDDVPVWDDYFGVTVTYSDVKGGWPGTGNVLSDPLFVDPNNGNYHLKSQASSWDPNSQSWVVNDVTSPCIDTGNPGCPLGDEPNDLSNVRINMGAYGGTAEASRTPVGWGLLGDLTNNGLIDNEDFAHQAMYWQQTESCQPGDLNRDGTVNLPDVVLTALDWLNVRSVTKAGMDYQIEACDPGAKMAGPEKSGQRFSAIVEGNYILFEDMMVANCCPDELSLEMIVEDDLITIYEIEHTSLGCYCICDFPVTATLGPFEPGSYTLAVYEDWGGFIGSTIVTIP